MAHKKDNVALKRRFRVEKQPSEAMKLPRISRQHLANIYHYSPADLGFAIAEITYDYGGVGAYPAIAIRGTDLHIELATGVLQKNTALDDGQLNLYAAAVRFEEDGLFHFFAPRVVETAIADTLLLNCYGSGVIE